MPTGSTRLIDVRDFAPTARDREILARLQAEPRKAAKVIADVNLWDGQATMLNALRETRRVAIRSGHGIGKTFAFALAVVTWLLEPGSIAVTTAPKFLQVQHQLWREIRRLASRARRRALRMSGDGALRIFNVPPHKTPLWEPDEERYAIGMTADSPEAFQGIHGRRVLVIADEAPGIGDDIFEAIEAITTGPDDAIMIGGNPTRSDGYFARIFRDHRYAERWSRVHIDDTKLPWVVDETVKIPAPGFVSREWIEAREDEWGVDHPLFLARVCGVFSDEAGDHLIKLGDIIRAMKAVEIAPDVPRILGVDVARFGANKTALAMLRGHKLVEIETYGKRDVVDVAAIVLRYVEQHAPIDGVAVDCDGLGVGVFDILRRELPDGVRAIAHNGSAKADRDDLYENARVETWAEFGKALQSDSLDLIDSEALLSQLSYCPYGFGTRDWRRLKLKSKDEMLRSGHASPDEADAVTIAYRAMKRFGRWGSAPARRTERMTTVRRFDGVV